MNENRSCQEMNTLLSLLYRIIQITELILLKEEQKKLRAEVTRWKNKCETTQNELRLEKKVQL